MHVGHNLKTFAERKGASFRLKPNLQIKSIYIYIITFKFTNSISHDELISAWAMMSKWPWSHCRKILLLWTAICLGFWTIWNWSNRTCNIQVRTLWLANKFLLCAYLWKPTVHWKTNKVTPRCHEIRIFMYVLTGKVVQIFWEVHKNLKKKSPPLLWQNYVISKKGERFL